MDVHEPELDDQLRAVLARRDAEEVTSFMRALPPSDTALTVSNLSEEEQDVFWTLLIQGDEKFAADLAEHFPDDYAGDLIEDLDPDSAAKLLDHFDSDEQVDILSRLDEDQSEDLLERMSPVEAEDVELRLRYGSFTAGGLMITEILKYPRDTAREFIVNDLQENYEKHRPYEHRYLFEVDAQGHLVGTIPMRKLVYSPKEWDRKELYADHIQAVPATMELDDLTALFDRADHSVMPIIDEEGRLIGAITRAIVQEAIAKRQEEQLMQFGGVISGEELRIMPFGGRCLKRLAFLLPSILLSYLAVSVIALYEPVIEQISALAVFLPMVANLSGAAGNQAVAVSMRELTLGLIDHRSFFRVFTKEVFVGMINGVAIGFILGGLTYLLRPTANPLLPLVIGGSYACSSVLAVCLGGGLPLLMKWLRVDPAMLSSPVLTTLTDMTSFFLVLSLASTFLLS
jgi:magnesium transporter